MMPVVAALGTWALVVNGTFFRGHISTAHAQPGSHAALILFSHLHPALLAMVEAQRLF